MPLAGVVEVVFGVEDFDLGLPQIDLRRLAGAKQALGRGLGVARDFQERLGQVQAALGEQRFVKTDPHVGQHPLLLGKHRLLGAKNLLLGDGPVQAQFAAGY